MLTGKQNIQLGKFVSVPDWSTVKLTISLLRCFRLILIFKMYLLLSAGISQLKDLAYIVFIVSLSVLVYIIYKL